MAFSFLFPGGILREIRRIVLFFIENMIKYRDNVYDYA